jgi:methionyl-tRNA formyltransferase
MPFFAKRENRDTKSGGKPYYQLPRLPILTNLLGDTQFPSPFNAEQHSASQVLIVSSFGRYIPWNVLKRFQNSRRLNLHPSMIPRYRGAAPIQWAIADGLDETGVSVIEVEKVSLGYDVGDIWAQKPVVRVCFREATCLRSLSAP